MTPARRWATAVSALGLASVLLAAAAVWELPGAAPKHVAPKGVAPTPAAPGPVETPSCQVAPAALGAAAGFSPGAPFVGQSGPDLARDLEAMAATGARWLRVDFDWSFIESERGTLRWEFSDRIVSRASACGFKIIALAAYTPAWARPAGTTHKHPPSNPGDFAAFVSRAVRRYRPAGVEVWEIWNEPNIDGFWRPAPDPRAYATLLGAASAAVRAADPAAMVITGGLSPAEDAEDGSQMAPMTFLENLYRAGAGPSFDAVAVHPYSFPVGPTDASVDWNLFVRLPQIHDLLAAHGDGGKQLWLTEYGAPTGGEGAVSEADQARFVSEAYAAVGRWPWAGPLLWYSLRDQKGPQSDRESHFGLFRQDFRPKTAAAAFTAALKGPPEPAAVAP